MKPAPFTYHDPETVDEAIALLGQHEDAKLLAGGQSLMPMLNMRFVVPDHVVDLNGVAGLAGITDTGDALEIGAMTRQRDLMRDAAVGAKAPIIPEALEFVGHFQTRNRGTIGGSLCHLDPAAEQPCLMAVYDAVLTVQGPDGAREVPFAEWPLAYMIPSIGPDELLTRVRVPSWAVGHGYGFAEFARRHGDFAIVSAAALLEITGGSISRAAIAIGGADVRPIRLEEAETALVGQAANAESFKAAGEMARKIDAISDAYVSSAYRQRLAATMVERALAKAGSRAGGVPEMADTRDIEVTVNGESHTATVETRISLGDFLRQGLGKTGTHMGCEHGVCGACTVLVDGEAVRSCLMLAVQANGHEITTIEGLADADGTLSPLQEAFWENHGLQCGFCTPGMLTSLTAFLKENPDPSEREVREAISGNICRCTGYQGIVDAALSAAKTMREG